MKQQVKVSLCWSYLCFTIRLYPSNENGREWKEWSVAEGTFSELHSWIMKTKIRGKIQEEQSNERDIIAFLRTAKYKYNYLLLCTGVKFQERLQWNRRSANNWTPNPHLHPQRIHFLLLLSNPLFFQKYCNGWWFWFSFSSFKKSVFGRSCDRSPRHRFFSVSLCL